MSTHASIRRRLRPAHARQSRHELMPLVALAMAFVGGMLGYFVAMAAISDPHSYHLLGIPVGALLGWLIGQAIYTLQRRRSAG